MVNRHGFLLTGLTVDWSENDQKKRIINVPNELYEQGCIQDVEAGLKVPPSSTAAYFANVRNGPLAPAKPHVLPDRPQRRWATR